MVQLVLQPDQFEASYLLARSYYEVGMYPQAETVFERAASLRPTTSARRPTSW